MMRRVFAIALAAMLFVACGGDDDDTSETSAPTTARPSTGTPAGATTSSPTTTAGSTSTAVASTAPTTAVPSTPAVDTTPPAQVTGLVVTAGGGSGEVSLHWDQDPDPDVVGYNVYRSATAGGPAAIVATVARADVGAFLGGLFFTDVPGTAAYYQVTALDSHGNEGPPSAEVCGAPVLSSC